MSTQGCGLWLHCPGHVVKLLGRQQHTTLGLQAIDWPAPYGHVSPGGGYAASIRPPRQGLSLSTPLLLLPTLC